MGTGEPSTERGPAIRLEEVSIRFRVPHEKLRSLKEYAIRVLQNRLTYEEFWAVRRVSFEVRQGEVLGLIGRNGAGKSTVLKLIARVLRPTEGRVPRGVGSRRSSSTGRVPPRPDRARKPLPQRDPPGALAPGARSSLGRIVEFAELEPFIDAPLRTYSSGMVARLGFAIATEQRPDVLLMDEVLSVGDQAFQAKCKERFETFRANGTAIVLVSHDQRLVAATCQRVVWLERGEVCRAGPAAEVVAAYALPA